jgi:YidC/Oxa1 family membrane protein insertase
MIQANVLQPLIDVFEAVLKFFHNSVGVSWGTSIILLTVVVRAALLPLAIKQFRSMAALQRIAPELKKLQDRYKEDKPRLQQETMKFYQEHKVNPFASCLPLLAQLPVFISLFYMLQKDLRLDICGKTTPCGSTAESQFLFIPDITDKATGGVLVVLLVLYVGSQLVSSLLMMTATTDKTQRMIMLVLPFVFVPFIFSFPAGLLIYWITTNVWTIGQQQFLRRVIGKEAAGMPTIKDAVTGHTAHEVDGDDTAPSVKPRRAVLAAGGSNGSGKEQAEARTTKAPPPPPRRKKKRSGRRR